MGPVPEQYRDVWDEAVLDLRDAAERLRPILVELGDNAEIISDGMVIKITTLNPT